MCSLNRFNLTVILSTNLKQLRTGSHGPLNNVKLKGTSIYAKKIILTTLKIIYLYQIRFVKRAINRSALKCILVNTLQLLWSQNTVNGPLNYTVIATRSHAIPRYSADRFFRPLDMVLNSRNG